MAEMNIASEVPRAVVEQFRSVLTLPDQQLIAINQWAREHLTAILESDREETDLRQVARELGVMRSAFAHAMSFIGTVMFSEDLRASLLSGTFKNDLKEAGVESELAEKADLLLRDITVSARDAVYLPQRGIALNSIIPTLEDASIVCDLRAIFQRFPSPSPSPEHEKSLKVLLGFEPIVLVLLGLNDGAGNDRASIFQVTERGLRSLLKTLQEALVQLEIVKEEQKSKINPEVNI